MDASVGRLQRTEMAASSIEFGVEGMTCASCVGRVERALRAIPGATDTSVNLATERARVTFTGPADAAVVREAIEGAGYDVAEATTEIAVDGMTCASCVGRVERALAAVPGVKSVNVNLATERATVRHADGVVTTAALVEAVEDVGYQAKLVSAADAGDEADAKKAGELKALQRDVAIAAVLTLPVFVLEMGAHLVPAFHHAIDVAIGRETSWLIQFALTTLVLFGPGLRFFRKGIPALLHGGPDMNSLVALGSGAA